MADAVDMMQVNVKVDTSDVDKLGRVLDAVKQKVTGLGRTKIEIDAEEATEGLEGVLDALDGVEKKSEQEIKIETAGDLRKAQEELEKVERGLQKLEKRRKILVEAPQTDKVKRDLASVEKAIQKLTGKKHEITVAVNQSALNKAKAAMTDAERAMSKMFRAMLSMSGASSGLARALGGLSNVVGGPLMIGMGVAVAAFYKLYQVLTRNDKKIQEMKEGFLELGKKALESGRTASQMEIAAAREVLRERRKAYEEQKKTLDELEDKAGTMRKRFQEITISAKELSPAMQEAVPILRQMTDKTITAADALEELRKIEARYEDHPGLKSMIKSMDELATVQTTVAVGADELLQKEKALAQISDDIGNALRVLEQTAKIETAQEAAEYLRQYTSATEGAKKATEDFTRKTAESALTLLREKAAAEENAEKKAALNVQIAELTRRVAEAQKDQLQKLEDQYATQRQIATALVKDEQGRSDALLSIEAKYLQDREKLLREKYAAQVAAGQVLTEEEVKRLQEVADKSREVTQAIAGRELEAAYQARVTLAKAAAAAEITIDAESLEKRREYLDARLAMQIANAEESIRVNGRISDEEIKAIQATQREVTAERLKNLNTFYERKIELAKMSTINEKESEREILEIRREWTKKRIELLLAEMQARQAAGQAISKEMRDELTALKAQLAAINKELGKQTVSMKEVVAQFANYLKESISTLTEFFTQTIEQQIQVAEREYRAASKRMEAEHKQQIQDMKDAYKEQLQQIEEAERRKTEITEEYNEKRAAILEQMQEMMSAEEYLALQEQLEEARAAFDEEILQIEESNMTKEELEAEHNAKMEQLEADHLAKMEAMQKDHEKKVYEMELKKFRYNQAASLAQAMMSIAQGVAQAMSYGIPLGPIFASIVGTLGAVQLAMIARQQPPPPPSFREGGIVGPANADLYSMVPRSRNPEDKTLVWASQGEEILSRQEAAIMRGIRANGGTFADALIRTSEIRAAESIGGGTSFTRSDNRQIHQHNEFKLEGQLSPRQAQRVAERMTRAAWRGGCYG
ncbi:MAG: hypothetical protein FWF99_00050 [Desulfovibrionaceae bacterium]|nr:hypothetical protein [Desulfovibrionaceae bacterium]